MPCSSVYIGGVLLVVSDVVVLKQMIYFKTGGENMGTLGHKTTACTIIPIL
jgi:hypothetical protein